MAIIAESHTPEILTRHLLNGLPDLAFVVEPAQLEVLQIKDVGVIDLVVVGDRPNADIETAQGDRRCMNSPGSVLVSSSAGTFGPMAHFSQATPGDLPGTNPPFPAGIALL